MIPLALVLSVLAGAVWASVFYGWLGAAIFGCKASEWRGTAALLWVGGLVCARVVARTWAWSVKPRWRRETVPHTPFFVLQIWSVQIKRGHWGYKSCLVPHAVTREVAWGSLLCGMPMLLALLPANSTPCDWLPSLLPAVGMLMFFSAMLPVFLGLIFPAAPTIDDYLLRTARSDLANVVESAAWLSSAMHDVPPRRPVRPRWPRHWGSGWRRIMKWPRYAAAWIGYLLRRARQYVGTPQTPPEPVAKDDFAPDYSARIGYIVRGLFFGILPDRFRPDRLRSFGQPEPDPSRRHYLLYRALVRVIMGRWPDEPRRELRHGYIRFLQLYFSHHAVLYLALLASLLILALFADDGDAAKTWQKNSVDLMAGALVLWWLNLLWYCQFCVAEELDYLRYRLHVGDAVVVPASLLPDADDADLTELLERGEGALPVMAHVASTILLISALTLMQVLGVSAL